MNDALVYLSAILFFISIFPLHVINYAYISTSQRYASFNVTVFRLFTVLNVNTERPPKKDEDKKEKDKKDGKFMKPSYWLKMFNSLCLTKIVQLGDYGIQNPNNAYVALANKVLTDAVYTFVKINGGRTKLKNYTILNYEHENVNYYLKIAGVINIITLTRLFTIFIWGKLNERKIKEVSKG